MASLVELHEIGNEKLEEMLEDAREEMFTLRFQRASGQLEDYSQIKKTRRSISRFETLIHMRNLAVKTAVSQPEIAAQVKDIEWSGIANYNYEDAGWNVVINDDGGSQVATALVDLNQKKPKGRRSKTESKNPVLKFEVQ